MLIVGDHNTDRSIIAGRIIICATVSLPALRNQTKVGENYNISYI